MWTLAMGLAWAAPPEQHLTWDLAIGGQPAGSRQLTIRYLPGEDGRILEAYTSVTGQFGPVKLNYEQRMTGHVRNGPADLHSVADEGNVIVEVQARWAPAAWTVTTTLNGVSTPATVATNRLDLSTLDLLDPLTSAPFAGRTSATVLVAETGEILTGAVEPLGASEVTVAGTTVPVTGYAWTSTAGRSELYYSADGFLVRYQTRLGGKLAGVAVEGVLRAPPPAGLDQFPVGGGAGGIDAVDL